MVRLLCLLFFFTSNLAAATSFSLDQIADRFPYRGFEENIEFWTSIFTEYGERQVLLHDQDDLRLIYEVVTFDKGVRNDTAEFRRQRTDLRKRERQLQKILDNIRAWGPDSDRLTREHHRIIQVLTSHGYDLKSAELRKLRGNIRSQRGIKEKFRESLIRSGKYLTVMEGILEQHGVPTELVFLPHVESSFDYKAYSKRGAAGIWQFIRSTGRQFMTISNYVDERLDPLKATESAARLLKQNYKTLESWPLAVTAFNHGRQGMARAKKRHGDDFTVIVKRYKSRTFGFASKNFYSEFLAAVQVARNYTDYFGPLDIAKPLQFDTVSLDRPYHLDHITAVPDLNESVLRDYNPQVRNPIWQGSKVFPRGLTLRLPPGKGEAVTEALKSAPAATTHVFVADNGSLAYRVQYGDTLSDIAASLGTSMRSLQRANNISNAHRIYPGQLLLVEGPSGLTTGSTVPGTSARASQYRVRSGDTLDKIASRFAVSMRQLQQLNNLDNPHRIYPGQILQMGGNTNLATGPEAAAISVATTQYRVRSGDTLDKIAGRFAVSMRQLQRTNNIDNPHRIYPGQVLQVSGSSVVADSPARPDQYRVRRGDTLEEIAGRFGTSVRQLQSANRISNPHRIFLGQVLLIP
ncbi:MAG: LysM peptidoglycan-binding domain-containing protein [Acidobacteriota bacterium]